MGLVMVQVMAKVMGLGLGWVPVQYRTTRPWMLNMQTHREH